MAEWFVQKQELGPVQKHAGQLQAPLHARANARQVFRLQAVQTDGKLRWMQHGQAIRFLHAGSNFSQEAVGR